MAVITMRQMLEAGVHFGHQTRRWNPKMKRFIFGERNGIYIIDLQQTLKRIETAYTFVRDMASEGGTVLFIGTKKQAQDPIASFEELSHRDDRCHGWSPSHGSARPRSDATRRAADRDRGGTPAMMSC